MPYEPGQSAVIVPVPAVEPLVSRWRRRFDVSTRHGVPAHVTVLYPFLHKSRLDEHLTVAHDVDEAAFSAVEREVAPRLPVRARVEAAWLYSYDGERWRPRARLPFG